MNVWLKRGRGLGHTVRAGGSAAVGVVTELMDVEATLGVGIVARDVPADGSWARLGGLLEGDGAPDVGVTTEDSNCRQENRSQPIKSTV